MTSFCFCKWISPSLQRRSAAARAALCNSCSLPASTSSLKGLLTPHGVCLKKVVSIFGSVFLSVAPKYKLVKVAGKKLNNVRLPLFTPTHRYLHTYSFSPRPYWGHFLLNFLCVCLHASEDVLRWRIINTQNEFSVVTVCSLNIIVIIKKFVWSEGCRL